MSLFKNHWRFFAAGLAVLSVFGFLPGAAFSQSNPEQSLSFRESLIRQIEQLEQEIKENEEKAKGITKDIDVIVSNIKNRELQIKQLNSALKATELEIGDTEKALGIVKEDINRQKQVLAENILTLDQADQGTLLELFLQNRRLSRFVESVNQLQNIQSEIASSLEIFKTKKKLLEEKQDDLENQSEEYDRLRALEVSQKRQLETNRSEKNTLLKSTKKQIEARRQNLSALRQQLFYLEQTGISAETAVQYATLAANKTGIRPAFLLALLEVETGKAFKDGVITAGTYLGKGNWKRDLYDCLRNQGKYAAAESQKNAFFEITEKLGYNPDKMPVSARPSYGCGGAMGSAQFLPVTWLRFESRVTQLTGHNPPDPWRVEDAFMAAALYLADAGATSQTSEAERRAAKAYISGTPNCTKSICNVYSSQILSLANAIERNL